MHDKERIGVVEARSGNKNRVGDPLVETERKEAQELVQNFKAATTDPLTMRSGGKRGKK